MMKRILCVAVDAGMFLIMLLAWGIIAALGAGFLEIAFAWKIFSSTAGLTVLSVVILLGAGFLTIAGPRVVFGQTPGQSLFFRKQSPGSRPAIYWFAWLGILAAVYFAMWMASAAIFNPMAKREREILQATGFPADWRQAFPEYNAEDSAAPLLKLASESLRPYDTLAREQSIDWAFRIFTEVQDSVTLIWPAVDRLMDINARPLEWAEEASRCERLYWHDYRNTAADSLITLPLPNYISLQRICKLSMLQGARAMRQARVAEAKAAVGRAQRLLKLQTDDPTLIGKMISMAQVGIICNGLAGMARMDPSSYALIKEACGNMPDVSGQVKKGTTAELAVLSAVFDNWYRGLQGMGPKGWRTYGLLFGGTREPYIVAVLGATFYRVWAPWDRYCLLRSAGLVLETMAQGESVSNSAEIRAKYEAFRERHNRIPALFTNIVMPNFPNMFNRELEAGAKPNNVLLFAAVVNYRQKTGMWPKDLTMLVPAYFAELPKNPVDGQHYTYILSKGKVEVRGNDSKGDQLLKSSWVKNQ